MGDTREIRNRLVVFAMSLHARQATMIGDTGPIVTVADLLTLTESLLDLAENVRDLEVAGDD